jgi:hypothetical protein
MSLLEQASLVMIPSGYKEDVVYCPKPTDGSGDLTFTRASDGTRVNSSGLVENVPWNLLQESETFDNAIWQKSGISVTANAAENPLTGLTNADKLVADNANNFHYIYEPITYTNDQYTLFAYIKADGYSWFVIDSGLSDKYAYYNATTGVVGGTGSQSTATIESVGNGWYKAILTFTGVASSVGIYLSVRNANNGGSFTGDGVGGILIYGAQLNYGSTAKPYFPTTDRQNVPRLTYEGGCPSLLLEPQRTNLNTYSEDWSTGWSGANTALTTNDTTSPDGTQNADKLGATGGTAYYAKAITSSTGSNSFSVFMKYGNRQTQQIYAYAGGVYFAQAVFDLQNGTVSSTISGTAQIENYGNGWYRCTVTGSAVYSIFVEIGIENISDGTYTYCWGAQLEYDSSYPTSYIPTTSAAVTRVADVAYKTGISSLIGQTEGVFYAEFIVPETQSPSFFSISDGTTSNRIIFGYYAGELKYFVNSSTGSFSTIGTIDASPTVGQVYKIAIAYKNNDFVVYKNGTNTNTLTTFTVPTSLSAMDNEGGNAGQNIYASVKEILLFKTRLTNDQLSALTSL